MYVPQPFCGGQMNNMFEKLVKYREIDALLCAIDSDEKKKKKENDPSYFL